MLGYQFCDSLQIQGQTGSGLEVGQKLVLLGNLGLFHVGKGVHHRVGLELLGVFSRADELLDSVERVIHSWLLGRFPGVIGRAVEVVGRVDVVVYELRATAAVAQFLRLAGQWTSPHRCLHLRRKNLAGPLRELEILVHHILMVPLSLQRLLVEVTIRKRGITLISASVVSKAFVWSCERHVIEMTPLRVVGDWCLALPHIHLLNDHFRLRLLGRRHLMNWSWLLEG